MSVHILCLFLSPEIISLEVEVISDLCGLHSIGGDWGPLVREPALLVTAVTCLRCLGVSRFVNLMPARVTWLLWEVRHNSLAEKAPLPPTPPFIIHT